MIASMTAFSRKTYETEWGSVIWELRSVNHRYLDLSVRLPEAFREIEKAVRDEIQQKIKRGKVELILNFQPGKNAQYDFVVDEILVQKLAEAGKMVMKLLPDAQINIMDVLRWEGVLQVRKTSVDQISAEIITLLKAALSDLIAMRHREGDALKSFLLDCLARLHSQIITIRSRLPDVIAAERQRILHRFADLNLSLDKDRLEQEMLWFTQKMDTAEELLRLETHLAEVRNVLLTENAVGRKLDFLMQELNREANTIASKSADAAVSQAAIEMKVIIEQMREQVQNIE